MTHKHSILLTVWALTGFAISGLADDAPLWDLAKHDIPGALQKGIIQKVDGKITLRDGAAFAVPAEAFPDQKNFTVQVTASLCELVQDGFFTAMKKQTEKDDGFTFGMNYRKEPWYARHVAATVNNIFMAANAIGGQRGPQADTPYTFTVAVRDGYASFYIDDAPYKSCYMEMVANQEPMWIGHNLSTSAKPMPAVISGVKVYGPGFKYVSVKEPKNVYPRGAVAGKGWALDIPKIEHPEWPKVLIYGDSISMGYRGSFIPEMLKRNVYVFHCCHFVGGDVPEQALTEMAGRYRFDAVVFNNGLHSLHWTTNAVSDSVVQDRMRKLARCFKKGAPQAKIFYLMTTPHTAPKPAPDQPVASLGEKNDVVVRLNTLSAPVMKEQGIEAIDIYAVLAKRLELASGDGYHWQGSAYQIITDEIGKRILPTLGKK
ncbi:MAG TPA: SGNH/GDSL hydrolase family protein [Kiritimatiellia bacterium]|nr:SGNH/GDSL hydrolase family protein [Kiritimatiellia bacterium]HPS06098.1 SGNH/GDSL hydrolase family protein [Kiritimatiellia bacterium]